MRIVLLLIFCFCIIRNVSSQQKDTQKNIVREKYAMTLAPAFFVFDRLGLQPGFQFRLDDSWALITEIGVPVTKTSEKGNNYQKTQIVKLASELKYYPRKLLSDRFYSFQIGYMQRNFIDSDSGKYHNPGAINEIGYSCLTVKSPVYFFALKWGSEAVQWRKVFLDTFFGLGIRVIPTKYKGEGTYAAGQWQPRDNIAWMAPIAAWEYDKTCIRPHFTLGFRIGGKF